MCIVYPQSKISWNQITVLLFSRRVNLTEFLQKHHVGKVYKVPLKNVSISIYSIFFARCKMCAIIARHFIQLFIWHTLIYFLFFFISLLPCQSCQSKLVYAWIIHNNAFRRLESSDHEKSLTLQKSFITRPKVFSSLCLTATRFDEFTCTYEKRRILTENCPMHFIPDKIV